VLDSLAKAIILWAFLFLGQFIGVNVITLAFGGSLPLGPPQWGSVGILWQFAPSLFGIPLGLAAYQWKLLRSSGKWIWIPGVAFALWDGLGEGIASMPKRLWEQYSANNPIAVGTNMLTLSCALYALTLVMLSWLAKRRQTQRG